jgi:membrane protein implicated in regulation of membrane protease activity
VPKAYWNPVGLRASAIGGAVFGVLGAVAVSLFSGTWWWLLTAIPMAVAWALLWRYYYPRVYERFRGALERRED